MLLFLGLGFIVFENFTHAWYSGNFSWKPISWVKLFIFELFPSLYLLVGDSIENCFLLGSVGICLASLIALIGTGVPNAPANADCRFLVDFLVASADIRGNWGCVFFWFSLLGDGAVFSNVEDQASLDDVCCSGVSMSLFVGVLISFYSSDLNCIPLVGFICARFPPDFCPVCFAFFFLWLSCDCYCLSFLDIFLFLNMGCCGAFGFSMFKTIVNLVLFSARIYMQRTCLVVRVCKVHKSADWGQMRICHFLVFSVAYPMSAPKLCVWCVN